MFRVKDVKRFGFSCDRFEFKNKLKICEKKMPAFRYVREFVTNIVTIGSGSVGGIGLGCR